MAANPMQKKVRNSFLLGVMITLIICILIVGLLYFLFFSNKAKSNGVEVKAYVLNRDVKSGQTITKDMLTETILYSNMIPANYITPAIMETIKWQYGEPGNKVVLNTNKNGETYIEIKDGGNSFEIASNEKNHVLVKKDEVGYYIVKKGTTEKLYIDLDNVPVVAKINMSANTVLTIDSVSKSDEIVTDDLRVIEYNMMTLPVDISVGDYIDIRLTFPNGQDYVVVSKKQVKSIIGNTVRLKLTEDEILMMSSAIVESYIMGASNLYVVEYAEPGLQVKATNTYIPTAEVRSLIETDSNIVETAKNKLKARFESTNTRGDMDSAVSQYDLEELDNIEAGIKKQIEDAKAAREQYLQSLEAPITN